MHATRPISSAWPRRSPRLALILVGPPRTPVRVIDLDKLIELKRAVGRPKDFEALAELEAILEEREHT